MDKKEVLRASAPAISYLGRKFRPGGISETFTEFGCTVAYTSTCAHCQRFAEAATARELREKVDVCRGCMRLICLSCARKPCLPWEKQCEYQEREYLKRRIEDKLRCY
jgi:hypothetical protein